MHAAQGLAGHEAFEALDAEGELALGFHAALADMVEVAGQQVISLQPMHLKQYLLEADPTLTVYEFTSEGPRGRIPKLVIFAETNQAGLYNLALGDKDLLTGELDDTAISNNGDSEQVLATVAGCVYAFFNRYPDAVIFAAGNTPARTRLYRMGLTKYQEEANADFELYGRHQGTWEGFAKGVTYDAFLIRRIKQPRP